MNQKSLDKIHGFWARSLGCPKQKLQNPQTGIYTRKTPTDYTSQHNERKIDIFLKNEEKIISCHENHLPELQKSQILETEISERKLQQKVLDIKEVLGPAFLSFADCQSFQPTDRANCRKLEISDQKALKNLKHRSNKKEIEDSISDYKIGEYPLFGKFEDGEIVAVSGYEIWDEEIAFLVVFVSEDHRGKGFGKEVVSEAVDYALDQDLIPCYRTLEKWKSSVNLARNLGFEKYASTYLAELKKK